MIGNEKRNVYISCLNPLPFLPIVYGYLRAFAEKDERIKAYYRFQDPFFYKLGVEEALALIESPAVLGLSCYYWNFAKQMKLAKLAKARDNSILIIAGGPHVPKNDLSFFKRHPYIDIVVHGEGEQAFREILGLNMGANNLESFLEIKGVSVNINGECRFGGMGLRLHSPIPIDSPYLATFMDSSIEWYHKRNIIFYAPWETNRGCPYGCSFCDWGSATLNKINNFEGHRLLKEIAFFAENKIPQLFICDANFGIQARDEDIAIALVQAKKNSGFPTQIRINFAKNSNERVFRIGKLWSEAELLMGVTVSLQSNEAEVLKAIQRKNIGTEKYYELQRNFQQAKIHSYTELILGLPEETSASFKAGIETVLCSGNHNDLRVYDLIILPNVPMNDPAYLQKYGIKTIDKYFYNLENPIPGDEVEIVKVVIETNTLSPTEWIECFLYSKAIQFLHNGCYTRYIAIFLFNELGISYTQFYERFISWGHKNPQSIFGKLIVLINDLYRQYIDDPTLAHETIVNSQQNLVEMLKPYGIREEWEVEDFAWIFISRDVSEFYQELKAFLQTEFAVEERKLAELIKFQEDLILTSDYDPSLGKECVYLYDFVSYFFYKVELQKKTIRIHFKDVSMGLNNRYPIIKNDLRAFANAAVGESYPVTNRIRHFQHQIDIAEVEMV